MMEKERKVPTLRFETFSETWLSKTTGEISDCIVPGRNKPQQFNGNIPWITTPDIEHGNVIISSRLGLALTKEEAKSVGTKIVPSNSVIMSCVGELGLIAITANEIVINQQFHAFLPLKDIDYRFLMYSLSKSKEYINKIATKTAVPYLNKTNCNSIPLLIPSIQEQQKIASFLTAVDDKIQQLNKKKALLEKYKKGVMQQIFNQEIRFKDDEGKDYPDWEEKKLGDLAFSITNGISLDQNSTKTGVKVTRIETISEKRINLDKVGYVLTSQDISSYRLNAGDLLFSNINSVAHIGKVVLFNEKYELYHGMNLLRIRFNLEYSSAAYFAYLLSSKKYKNHFEMICNKAVNQASINQSELKKTIIKTPSLQEQTKIANFLTSIDNKINHLNQQIDQTKKYKKGLLQQMFV